MKARKMRVRLELVIPFFECWNILALYDNTGRVSTQRCRLDLNVSISDFNIQS